MKLSLNIEFSETNKKGEIYDLLIANDKLIELIDAIVCNEQCDFTYVTDITLLEKIDS